MRTHLKDLQITINLFLTLIWLDLAEPNDMLDDLQAERDNIKYRDYKTLEYTYGGKYESNE